LFPGRIRLGMAGGGEGAFIGAVHGIAARLDDRYALVAGALRNVMRGTAFANAAAARVSRIPGGHPEGYLEAFAALYGEVAAHLLAARDGSTAPKEAEFPAIDDGLRAVEFIEAVQASSRAGGAWTSAAI
jgi:hypothetical protein